MSIVLLSIASRMFSTISFHTCTVHDHCVCMHAVSRFIFILATKQNQKRCPTKKVFKLDFLQVPNEESCFEEYGM